MTRQIATAILLATALTMIACGLLTYAAARVTLLSELDAALITRAMAALPQAAAGGDAAAVPTASPLPGDRFIIENANGQTLARSRAASADVEPHVVSRTFTHGDDGEHLRTLVLDIATPARGNVRVIYSGSASAFDRLQARLAWTIASTIAAGVLLTLAAAAWVSRRVTRPLQRTADVIAAVDDASLDQRLDPADVPRELAPMIRNLNTMLGRLEDAFDRQRRFLADASHELRTPVAAIRASCEIALSRPRGAEQLAEVLRRTLRETIQLARLVEGMLESARGQSPAARDDASIDLTSLLESCVEQMRPLALAKSQTLEASIAGSFSMRGDADAVRSVVVNLLSNAIAYTQPAGTIALACDLDDRHRSFARIEVSDNGPGIEPGHVNRVFEPFFRADSARSPTEHLGLGLHIVQRHVQRLGGRIDLRSTPGEGTTFSVWLPAAMIVAERRSADGSGLDACSRERLRGPMPAAPLINLSSERP